MTIDTPEMYDQFKAAKFDSRYLVYTIKAPAHTNLFDEIKSFASKAVTFDDERIIFEDEHRNHISIIPKHKLVNANFQKGENKEDRLRILPDNYKTYNIRVNTLTAGDMKVIEDWKSAESIDIISLDQPDDVVMELLHEVEKSRNIRISVEDA